MSLITKKMKARDLDNSKLSSSLNGNLLVVNTPDVFGNKKMSFKQEQSTPTQAKKHGNSTENLFNLIQQTKTKNTQLEPILGQQRKLEEDFETTQIASPHPEEIGIGLQNPLMKKTTSNGYGNEEGQNIHSNSESPSKVMRTWSRPLINLPIKNPPDAFQPQICTCRRKRIIPCTKSNVDMLNSIPKDNNELISKKKDAQNGSE